MKSDRAVLILSCDKYSDLWIPFFKEFWKHWPDCPFKVYLGSNEVSFTGDKRVVNVMSGKDLDWSTSFRKLLTQIPEKQIFVWLEDAFITSKINSAIFYKSFDFLDKETTTHIHFGPNPKPDSIINKTFGMYGKGKPYRANAIGFWKKEYLERLLITGESVWNFEIMGSYRVSFDEGFYCLLKPALTYVHLVEKGRWIKSGLEYCKTNNVPLAIQKRTVARFNITGVLRDLYFKTVQLTPWTVRVKIMNLLRKLLISY